MTAHTPIKQLDLSRRAYNCLRRNELHTVGHVLAAGSDALLRIAGFGQVSLDEVTRELDRLGHTLTEHGFFQPTTLPALPDGAASLVKLLGLGDSIQVRQGLARVLLMLSNSLADPRDLLNFARDLEGRP